MNNKKNPILSIIASILIPATLILTYAMFLDKIPVEIQTLSVLVILVVLVEGIGLKAVANYMQLSNSFLVYVPFVRHFKLGEIIHYAGYEVLGRLRLSFITLVCTVVTLVASIIVEPGTLKASLIIITVASMLLHLVAKTVYVYLLTNMLSGTGLALVSLLVISQPFIIFKYKFEIKEIVKAENSEEYEDDSEESDDYDNQNYRESEEEEEMY